MNKVGIQEAIKADKKIILTTEGTIYPMLLDTLFRFGLYYLHQLNFINDSTLLTGEYIGAIVLMVFISIYNSGRVNRFFKNKLENIVYISSTASLAQVMLSVLFFFVSIYVIWDIGVIIGIESGLLKTIFTIVNVIIYGIALFYYNLSFPSRKISAVHIKNGDNLIPVDDLKAFSDVIKVKINTQEKFEYIETENIDRNDIEIAKAQVDVSNMVNRVDTYVLESIFIGALSFSGFLTIISSDKIQENIDTLKAILPKISIFIRDVLLFDLSRIEKDFDVITSDYSLFALISIESLICSTFFILVLAARIKFSNISEKALYLIDLARIFNGKEEEIELLQVQGIANLEKRTIYLRNRIDEVLGDIKKVTLRIKPIFRYIIIFRNLGLYTFYIVLITSGMYFSKSISLFILLIIFFGYIIKYLFISLSSARVEKMTSKYLKPKI